MRSREGMVAIRFDLGVPGSAGADFNILTADESGAHHFRHGILADKIGVFLVDLEGDLHLGVPRGLGDAQHGDLADLRIEHLDQGALVQVVALAEFYQVGVIGLEPAFALADHQQGHHGEDDQHQEKPPCQLFLVGKALFHAAMIPLSPGLSQAFCGRPGFGGLECLPPFFPSATVRPHRNDATRETMVTMRAQGIGLDPVAPPAFRRSPRQTAIGSRAPLEP